MNKICSIANVDPAQEIARLRASISQLESYISTHHGGNRTPLPLESTYQAMEFVDQDLPNYHINPHAILTNRGGAGIFIGPTSAAVHLVVNTASFLSIFFTVLNVPFPRAALKSLRAIL